MTKFHLIDVNGFEMGWVEADSLKAALTYAIKVLKRYDLDHAHEEGTFEPPCEACFRIKEKMIKELYH